MKCIAALVDQRLAKRKCIAALVDQRLAKRKCIAALVDQRLAKRLSRPRKHPLRFTAVEHQVVAWTSFQFNKKLPREIAWYCVSGNVCVAIVADHLRQTLLKGFDSKPCSCGMTIWMVPNGTGFKTPVDQHGNNHFLNCPNRDQYKRAKGGK